MNQSQEFDTGVKKEEATIYKTKAGFSILLTFGIILTLESLAFIMIGFFISRVTGVPLIPINLITIGFMLFGAYFLTYYYYSRYVRRELILDSEGVCLKVGKRSFEYPWSDFSIVALSVSYSHFGAKGYLIKLFEDDLKGEYIDLPIYRFPKQIDAFSLRHEIEERVRQSQDRKKE